MSKNLSVCNQCEMCLNQYLKYYRPTVDLQSSHRLNKGELHENVFLTSFVRLLLFNPTYMLYKHLNIPQYRTDWEHQGPSLTPNESYLKSIHNSLALERFQYHINWYFSITCESKQRKYSSGCTEMVWKRFFEEEWSVPIWLLKALLTLDLSDTC